MLNHKPISVERARMAYLRSMADINFAENGIERDKARTSHRRATQVLQNAQRMERNQQAARANARRRRRIDWNVAVF
ncbi:MAG: hypothetical protein O3B95_11390 [Chloroflexi bacterium]|nr:hypothetical protein [Chloroflexota bacterium]